MSQEGSIDPGEGTSGLETDARAVNRATLSGIQRLNESIASLSGYYSGHDEFESLTILCGNMTGVHLKFD